MIGHTITVQLVLMYCTVLILDGLEKIFVFEEGTKTTGISFNALQKQYVPTAQVVVLRSICNGIAYHSNSPREETEYRVVECVFLGFWEIVILIIGNLEFLQEEYRKDTTIQISK